MLCTPPSWWIKLCHLLDLDEDESQNKPSTHDFSCWRLYNIQLEVLSTRSLISCDCTIWPFAFYARQPRDRTTAYKQFCSAWIHFYALLQESWKCYLIISTWVRTKTRWPEPCCITIQMWLNIMPWVATKVSRWECYPWISCNRYCMANYTNKLCNLVCLDIMPSNAPPA